MKVQLTETKRIYNAIKKAEHTLLKSGIHNLCDVSDFIFKLNNNGVYIFSSKKDLNDEDNIVYYVGFSTVIMDRCLTSCNTRMRGKHKEFYLHVIDNYNNTDSQLLEILLINKYKPICNTASKYNDTSTFLNSIDISDIKTIKFIYDN